MFLLLLLSRAAPPEGVQLLVPAGPEVLRQGPDQQPPDHVMLTYYCYYHY